MIIRKTACALNYTAKMCPK